MHVRAVVAGDPEADFLIYPEVGAFRIDNAIVDVEELIPA